MRISAEKPSISQENPSISERNTAISARNLAISAGQGLRRVTGQANNLGSASAPASTQAPLQPPPQTKNPRKLLHFRGSSLWAKGDLNPHVRKGHWHLKPARLPFRHSPVGTNRTITPRANTPPNPQASARFSPLFKHFPTAFKTPFSHLAIATYPTSVVTI